MRSETEANRAIEKYSDMVYRLCIIHLKNRFDAEDIFQTVFLKYILSSVSFESEEHEKAWLIRITLNACKDVLKNYFRSHTVSLNSVTEQCSHLSEASREVLNAVLTLPEKYRDIVYLHYYEGYTVPETAKILNKNPNTVYTHLTRSKKLLKEKLGDDIDE